jgi:hypothetical protein
VPDKLSSVDRQALVLASALGRGQAWASALASALERAPAAGILSFARNYQIVR